MNILLTGGAGYIGSHTIIELDKAGHIVVVVDNLVAVFPAVPSNLVVVDHPAVDNPPVAADSQLAAVDSQPAADRLVVAADSQDNLVAVLPDLDTVVRLGIVLHS